MTDSKWEYSAWLIFGLAGVVGVCFIVAAIASIANTNAEKSRDIRKTKIEVCRTVTDDALRSFCVINGGASEPEG